MNQRKQDDLNQSLFWCASVPPGIVALVALLDGFSWVIRTVMEVMR